MWSKCWCARGLARLERAPDDARAQCAELTPRARRLLGDEFDRYRAELSALFEDFAQDDVAELFRLILKLCAGVDALEARAAERGGADEGGSDV